MATAVWKGQLTFGLVSVPIRLYRAARKERVRLHYLAPSEPEIETPEPAPRSARVRTSNDIPHQNETDNAPLETSVSRVTQTFQRPDTERALSRGELLRGHEVAPDRYVTFTPQELRKL